MYTLNQQFFRENSEQKIIALPIQRHKGDLTRELLFVHFFQDCRANFVVFHNVMEETISRSDLNRRVNALFAFEIFNDQAFVSISNSGVIATLVSE